MSSWQNVLRQSWQNVYGGPDEMSADPKEFENPWVFDDPKVI